VIPSTIFGAGRWNLSYVLAVYCVGCSYVRRDDGKRGKGLSANRGGCAAVAVATRSRLLLATHSLQTNVMTVLTA
jgi:hypothetical protein